MERSIKSNPLNKSIGQRKVEYPRPYKGVVNKKYYEPMYAYRS